MQHLDTATTMQHCMKLSVIFRYFVVSFSRRFCSRNGVSGLVIEYIELLIVCLSKTRKQAIIIAKNVIILLQFFDKVQAWWTWRWSCFFGPRFAENCQMKQFFDKLRAWWTWWWSCIVFVRTAFCRNQILAWWPVGWSWPNWRYRPPNTSFTREKLNIHSLNQA